MPKIIDLTGQQFGEYTVLERDSSKTGGPAYWICKCSCGNQKSVRGQNLRNGTSTHCGCKKIKKIDTTSMLGQKFGRLTIIERDLSKEIGHGNDAYWICQCECGNKTSVRTTDLKASRIISCGCYRTDLLKQRNTLDLTNQCFGKLTAIKNTYETKHNSYIWKCICDCGNIKYITAENLRSGKVNSCGCMVQSKGELKIEQILNKEKILYIKEYTFAELKHNNKYFRYDFAIFDDFNNLIRLIEFDGIQHYQSKEFFGGEEKFIQRQEFDNIKNQYAKEHNIPLVRIPYWEIDNLNIDMILGSKYLIN